MGNHLSESVNKPVLYGNSLSKSKKEIVQIGNIGTASDLDWTIVRIFAPKGSNNFDRAFLAGFLLKMGFAMLVVTIKRNNF